MTLKEVIQKVEREFGGKVIGIGDCKDRWIFVFDWQQNALSSIVFCCYKDDYEIGYFFPSDEPGIFKSAEPIPLPE